VLRTLDGGAHWVGLPAPRAALTLVETASSATTANVSRIRFADPSNGWAYGPGLWATHDGARSWHQVPIAGRVISLEAAAGQADLVASPCQPGTPCPGIALLQSPAGSDSFVPVARQSTAGRDIGALALHPPAGFAALGATAASSGLGGPTTVQATADTHTWRPFPDPCRVTQQLSLSSVAAADARTLFTLCSGEGAAGSTAKQVVATTDGRSAVVGAPSRVGDGGQLAAATSSTLLLAASSAASWLERSTDGGRHWATVTQYNDGGAGFVDLGFTTASQGVVIHGKPETATTQPGQVDELLATRDAGSTWHHVTFTS